jgi:hypothetical protein
MITNINQLDLNATYTYADYLLWKFEEQVELLKGKLFKMSPAPRELHQRISMQLSGEMYDYFKGKKCRLYSAPFEVRLPKESTSDEQIYTVVQPDLCVICDPSKLDERGCKGAPDLIVEILSPNNSRRDLKDKFEIYQEAGVPEYWIVHPTDKTLSIYVLEGGIYRGLAPIVEGDWVTSGQFPGLEVDTTQIFRE